MQYIDAAALRMQARAALPCLPPLRKTAKELLLDPLDATTTGGSEEYSGGVGEGDTIVHYIAGDLCLTGPADGIKRQNRGGTGGNRTWGREGNGSYGRNLRSNEGQEVDRQEGHHLHIGNIT